MGDGMNRNQIRVKVLGWIQDGDRVFVAEAYDEKQLPYYRSLGGSLEFGESSLDALKREFWEELQAELTQIEYLECIENLFTLDGQPRHEIIQLYRCAFADPQFYEMAHIPYFENNQTGIAKWIEGDRFLSDTLRLVPEACLKYCRI